MERNTLSQFLIARAKRTRTETQKSNESKRRRRLQSLPRSQNPYQDTNTAQATDRGLLHLSSTIMPKLTSNHFEPLPSFCADRNNFSQSIDALSLLRTELERQDHSQPLHRDLAPEAKGKPALMAVPKSNERSLGGFTVTTTPATSILYCR